MTETVLGEVRRAILSGALPPGSRVTQEQLAHQLAVSRAPVRQAMLILEREGLVQSDRWRGAIVTPLNPTLIRDIYQFRGEIERFVAAHLAARDDFDPTPLRSIVIEGRQAAAAGDIFPLIEIDLRFHTGLYDAVGNQVLSDVMRGQWTHIRRVMGATLAITGYRAQVWDEHTDILNAIAAHDAERAGQCASSHTTAACTALLETLSSQSPSLESLRPVPRPYATAAPTRRGPRTGR